MNYVNVNKYVMRRLYVVWILTGLLAGVPLWLAAVLTGYGLDTWLDRSLVLCMIVVAARLLIKMWQTPPSLAWWAIVAARIDRANADTALADEVERQRQLLHEKLDSGSHGNE